jgi:hypothetical protein
MGTIEESSSILPQEVANAPLTRTTTTKELGRKKRILIIDDEPDITLTVL